MKRDLTQLTPNENGNITISQKAELTPFEAFEIEQMQNRIYGQDEIINWDEEYD